MENGRVALMVDETWNILRAFIAWDSPGSVGQDLPRYDGYFPEFSAELYEIAMNDTEEFNNLYAMGEDPWVLGQIREYVDAEEKWIEQAGRSRLYLRQIEGKDFFLALFYESDDYLNRDCILSNEAEEMFGKVWPLCIIAYCLFALLLAIWVFRDAQKRNFKPAFWGALTLVGGAITWLVYMMIRPAPAVCPGCGFKTRREYAACPMCGRILRPRCANCGRGVEDDWRFCPYCASARDEGEGARIPLGEDGA